ncbi:MAG: hypothetical protein IM561_08965 [Microcystis sp. M60BS1]|uniref:hypothetical protein n=1 Tax=unclassified Microcystis TaxID=2643300 RepID=UPI00257E8D8C|nr:MULTISPECIES: hypothetical protein [unclassified Microcystis]MCA2594378.1 hypothetical protein [Microcystis sp. M38BS1]MCA6581498.1 hypothetical protein [Pseudanabaena sp. M34BS1SP1A06MG]MCA2510499.1 hypothetical protein [Microcystis sp. M60BS1]MCA2555785.1 hypothetical protein [Microcystis sp. M43BS1]MCA2591454.1 hypothetical protein [Microcystis sp. M31BS1]
MDLSSVLSSTATGGLIGTIGSLGGAAVEYINARASAKEQLKAKQVDYQHEIELQNLGASKSHQEAQDLFNRTDLENHFASLQKAIEDQTVLSNKVNGPVLDILALFRPSLTILLVLICLIFGAMKLEEYFNYAIELAAIAVTWWFGDRQRNKFGVR